MKKNILLFDKTHAYKSFFRKNFIDILNFVDYNKFDDFNDINFDDYDAVIFILNEEKELIDLMWAYTKVKKLYLSTKFNKINKRMRDMENIILLDLNKNKNEILKDIRFFMNLNEPIIKLKKLVTV